MTPAFVYQNYSWHVDHKRFIEVVGVFLTIAGTSGFLNPKIRRLPNLILRDMIEHDEHLDQMMLGRFVEGRVTRRDYFKDYEGTLLYVERSLIPSGEEVLFERFMTKH